MQNNKKFLLGFGYTDCNEVQNASIVPSQSMKKSLIYDADIGHPGPYMAEE